MIDSTATKSQLAFIKKLRDAGYEREEKLQHYLKEKGKSDVSDLSIKEASELIDLLMKIKGESQKTWDDLATKKQIQFIKKLQDTDKKQEITKKYLVDLKKESIDELTKKEASELIDKLIRE